MRTILDDVFDDAVLGIMRLFKAAAGSKEDAAAIRQNLSKKSALSKEFFKSPLSTMRKMFPAENIDRKEAGQIAEAMTGFLEEFKHMGGQTDQATLIRFLKIQNDFQTFAEGGVCKINSHTVDSMIKTLVHMNSGIPPEHAEKFKAKVYEFMNKEVGNSAFVHDPKYDWSPN